MISESGLKYVTISNEEFVHKQIRKVVGREGARLNRCSASWSY